MLNVKFIKAELKKNSWTETEFAKRLGMAKQHVNVILNFQKSCSMKTLCKMAMVFNCKLDDLWISQ